MPGKIGVPGATAARQVGPQLLLDRPRPPAARRAARRGWRGVRGAARRDRWSSEPRQAPGSAVSARAASVAPRARGVNRAGPDASRRQRLGAPGLLALEVERRQPDAIGELVADAPGEVLEPALRLVPGREDRRRQPLDVAVDVAGDRPEVVGRRDPAARRRRGRGPARGATARPRTPSTGGRAEALEDVLEADRPGRSPASRSPPRAPGSRSAPARPRCRRAGRRGRRP